MQSFIETLIYNNKLYRYESELNETKDEERIAVLKYNMEQLVKPSEITTNISHQDTFYTEIDGLMFKKQWNRMQVYHRLIKLKEYLVNTYKDHPLFDEICDKLSSSVENGKLTTKKSIIYDNVNAIITSIPALTIHEDYVTVKL